MISSRSVPTIVIGPKGLLRDSIASLVGGYSYPVTDSHHAAADMPPPPEEESPRMVLLIVRTVELAVAECASVRRTCPNCKIVAVLEESPLDEDFQKLAHSSIDACVHLYVSQDVLIRTLDLVMSGSTRIIVLADEPCASISPTGEGPQKTRSGAGPGDAKSQGDLSDKIPSEVANHDGPRLVPDVEARSCSKTVSRPPDVCDSTIAVSTANRGSITRGINGQLSGLGRQPVFASGHPGHGLNGHHADGRQGEQTAASIPSLSERERQIVDGLIKGQPNKTIARACGITEATVKVHMKAILRKVPCSNRTQVAIWALENAAAFRALHQRNVAGAELRLG